MLKIYHWWKALLLYTWFIILWGAFVRASGSGDGCGQNWPTCHGELFPPNSSIQTLIEYIHRATSGFYGIFVFVLVIYTILYTKKLKSRNSYFVTSSKIYYLFPILVLALTIFEALIGAKLVLSGLVGSNDSWGRALIMVIHLINTFVLVSSIMGTIILFSPEVDFSFDLKSINPKLYILSTFMLVLVASLGAITALGDTLYPAESLQHGITQDFALNTPWVLRVRVLHPILALLTALITTYLVFDSLKELFYKFELVWLYLTLTLGIINLLLLAPIYMQLIHLLVAQVLWAHHSAIGLKLFVIKPKNLI